MVLSAVAPAVFPFTGRDSVCPGPCPSWPQMPCPPWALSAVGLVRRGPCLLCPCLARPCQAVTVSVVAIPVPVALSLSRPSPLPSWPSPSHRPRPRCARLRCGCPCCSPLRSSPSPTRPSLLRPSASLSWPSPSLLRPSPSLFRPSPLLPVMAAPSPAKAVLVKAMPDARNRNGDGLNKDIFDRNVGGRNREQPGGQRRGQGRP